MARFDLFYSENRATSTAYNNTGTTSGSVTLAGNGAAFTLTGAPTLPFVEGQTVYITDGSKTAYCKVSKVTSTTNITLLPMRSALDTAGVIGSSFAGGSTISSNAFAPEQGGTLVVDLTDAPFTSATYLIVATGTLQTNNASSQVGAALRVGQYLGDPLSGTGGNGLCAVTFGTSTAEFAPFHGATTVTLSGGQRYEFGVDFYAATSNTSATLDEVRLVAIRYDSITAAGTGLTAEQTTTSTSDTTHLSLATNLTAGDYLVVGTWVAGISNVSYEVKTKILETATTIASSQVKPNATTDYISGGYMGVVTLGATNALTMKFATTNASGTAKIKNSFLAALRLPPGFRSMLSSESSNSGTTTSVTTSGTSFQSFYARTKALTTSGRYLHVHSGGYGADATGRYRVRMVTPGGTNTDTLSGIRLGTGSSNYLSTFMVCRETLSSGTASSALQVLTPTSGTTVRAANVNASFLLEKADLNPGPLTGETIIADFEVGGQIFKNWNSTTVAQRYWKHLEDHTAISRVILATTTSTTLTEHSGTVTTSDLKTTGGALSSNEWYWDADNHDLYVQMASGTPADAGKNLVVVPLSTLGREHVDLLDENGSSVPYEGRLTKVPNVTEELRSSNARFDVSRSIGNLQIAAADGEYDDTLVNHAMESFSVVMKRGWSSLSDSLADFDIYGTAITGLPSTDFDGLTIKLFDKHALLQKPVSTTTETIYEGTSSRSDQVIPVIYGTVRKIPAYRITNVTGAGNYNTFRVAAHAVKSVTAAYLDGTTSTTIASGNRDFSSTYTDAGKVRIKNDAFSDPTAPGDVVYLDLQGKTDTGLSSGTAITSPGDIIKDILTSYGGLAATDIDQPSMRLLDREWRSQLSGGAYTRQAPLVGCVISDGTVSDAISTFAGDVFAYVRGTTTGRTSVAVPDLGAGNLLANGGFETDSTSTFPWFTRASATVATNSARKFDGSRCAQIGNGSNANGALCQDVILPHGGRTYVLTGLVSLQSGDRSSFRVAVVRPNGTEVQSDAYEIGVDRWSRFSLEVTLDPGETGTAEIKIYPAQGSTTATSVNVDNVELYEVAAVLTEENSLPSGLEFSDEHYYEAAVSYDVNQQDTAHISRVVVTDSEARLASSSTAESKFLIQSSKRADIGTPLTKDIASASGIAAPIAAYFSRMRHLLKIDALGLDRIPSVGEYVHVRDNHRVPELASGFPIWRIVRVGFDPDNAKTVELEVERQSDPVIDRVDIAPDSIPMGAIMPTLSSGAITDFTEVTSMQGKYIVGNATPDLTTARGSYTHTHSLDHTHAIPSHSHNWSVTSVDSTLVPGDSTSRWWVSWGDAPVGVIFGPAGSMVAARGNGIGGHSHATPGGTAAASSASGTSGSSSAPTSLPGGTDPKFRRVRFMQRTDTATTTVDSNLIVGWLSSTVPAGWQRVTNLDGYVLRGATSLTALTATVATSTYSPSSSGSSLKVSVTSGSVAVGRRLTITNGANSMRVVVTAQNGTNDWQVTPLYESGDTVTTYAVGSTIAADTEVVGTTFAGVNHTHSGTIPSHTHSGGGHSHAASGSLTLGTATNVDQTIVTEVSPTFNTRALGNHSHSVYATLLASDTSSSAQGTISAAAYAPDKIAVVWIQPTTSNEVSLPAGCLILWSGTTLPAGYAHFADADGKLLAGAAASSGPSSTTGGHSHSMAPAAHTFSHSHGGTTTALSSDGSGTEGSPMWDNGSTSTSVAPSADRYPSNYSGHAHVANISVSSASPGMSSSSTSSAADTTLPPHVRIRVLKKS